MSNRRRINDCQGERIEARVGEIVEFPLRASRRPANDVDDVEAALGEHVDTGAVATPSHRYVLTVVLLAVVGIVLLGSGVALLL